MPNKIRNTVNNKKQDGKFKKKNIKHDPRKRVQELHLIIQKKVKVYNSLYNFKKFYLRIL